ncbi:MAG: hypothetical protein COY49_08425 [Comamonadaceae bacterium CG_4_10_14_0_8_um_filter_57_29]|nr:MAG: hypothetical protein COY49_08425 [Comamonadaceae bacterium CG_4_10_14_0_8_um_filter_57_29]
MTDNIDNPGASANNLQKTGTFGSIKQGLLEAIEHAESSVATTDVTRRLDTDVLEKFVATGDGWRTRINEVLKAWIRTNS